MSAGCRSAGRGGADPGAAVATVRPEAGLRRAQPLLGTFVVVTVHGVDGGKGQSAIDAAFAAVRRVDALMSLHRPDSELVRLNAAAARDWVVVSPELFEVVAAAGRLARETDGAFDATIRPVADLWGFIWKEHRMPSPEELAAVLPRVGHALVELDADRRAVRFARPGVSLDLGGIAKGYAVDAALAALRSAGVSNAMVRAGGDLRVMGAPPGRTTWEVQLEDPFGAGNRVAIELRDAAVSTSGNYENFFIVEGRRYSHLLNPRTGRPVEGVAACSVIAPTCLESDALATGLFVLGPERSVALAGARRAFRMTLMPSFSATGRGQAAAGPVIQSVPWREQASEAAPPQVPKPASP